MELTWKERGRLWMRLGIRIALTAAALLLLFLAVPPLLSLFMPFVLAFLMAWLLNRPVQWLHRKLHISRRLVSLFLILLAFSAVGGALFWFVYRMGSEVYALVANWSSVGGEIEAGLNAVGDFFARFFSLLPEHVNAWLDALYLRLEAWLQEAAPKMLTSLGKGAGSFVISLPSAVIAGVVFLMASYFVTADYPRIRLMVTGRMNEGMRRFFSHLRDVAVGALGGYVKAQLILSLAVFLILLAGFTLMGQGYALLLAFLLAVMDFIPIIGSGTAMVPWAAVDLAMGHYRQALELMIVWGVICLFRRLAEPKIVGNQTGLSPILSLVSIYVGMRLGGVMGMVLGPVALLIAINLLKMDTFSGARRDVRLAAEDVRSLLSGGRKGDAPDGENSKNL